MALNANWIRWINASIADHLHTALNLASLPLVIEFLDERDDDWLAAPHKAEATITGIQSLELGGGEFDINVGVFVVISSHKQVADSYTHMDKTGAVAEALDKCIVVYDYGTNPTPVEIFRLKPAPNQSNSTEQLRPTDTENLVHSVVEVVFNGQITT